MGSRSRSGFSISVDVGEILLLEKSEWVSRPLGFVLRGAWAIIGNNKMSPVSSKTCFDMISDHHHHISPFL